MKKCVMKNTVSAFGDRIADIDHIERRSFSIDIDKAHDLLRVLEESIKHVPDDPLEDGYYHYKCLTGRGAIVQVLQGKTFGLARDYLIEDSLGTIGSKIEVSE